VTIATSGTVAAVEIAVELALNDAVSLDFYPQNEGEIAYYVFKMPLANFDIKTSYSILLAFPFDYDFIVGLDFLKVSSVALQGALKHRILPRHIIIDGFYEHLAFTGVLDITVFGVINPNRENNNPTGTFTYGVLDGNTLLQGSINIPGIIP
jgi:hypothetical protein